jgi:hypothetical protein
MQAQIGESDEPSAEARSRWLQMIPANVFYETSVSIVALSKSEKLLALFNNSNLWRMFMYGSKNARKADVVSGAIENVEIHDAGHFLLLDQPDACYRALCAFITGK